VLGLDQRHADWRNLVADGALPILLAAAATAPPPLTPPRRYGKQYVPITKEEQLKYEPERDFQVLGCVARDAIPRW
jgi:hypothetical protein